MAVKSISSFGNGGEGDSRYNWDSKWGDVGYALPGRDVVGGGGSFMRKATFQDDVGGANVIGVLEDLFERNGKGAGDLFSAVRAQVGNSDHPVLTNDMDLRQYVTDIAGRAGINDLSGLPNDGPWAQGAWQTRKDAAESNSGFGQDIMTMGKLAAIAAGMNGIGAWATAAPGTATAAFDPSSFGSWDVLPVAEGASVGSSGAAPMSLDGFMNTAANNPFPDAGANWWETTAGTGNPLNTITAPNTGFPAIDFPGQVVNLAGGGMTAAPGMMDQVMSLVSKYGTTAINAVKSLVSNGGSESDLMNLLGKIAPAALGAFASNSQAGAMTDLARRYESYGAPSRERYESTFRPGFSMESDPGFTDAINAASKANLHGLSTTGNPALSPNAQAQNMSDLYSKVAYPALVSYRSGNANAGGISNSSSNAFNAETGAIQQKGNVFNAVGAGLNDVFNPAKTLVQTLAELRKAGL